MVCFQQFYCAGPSGTLKPSGFAHEAGEMYHYYVYSPFGENLIEWRKGIEYSNILNWEFNGKEVDGETGNMYYGARYYDPKISMWLSVDPLSHLSYNETPYHFVSNNPIQFIDPDGRHKWPASKRKEYNKNYPMITKYFKENMKNDVMKSDKIIGAFEQHTRSDTHANYPNNTGNLTIDKVEQIFNWGSEGPEILIRDNPGGAEGAYGFYNTQTGQIEISTELMNKVETILQSNASPEAKQEALLGLFGTILHETVHYGDYLDGLLNEGEPGIDFVGNVWGEVIIENGIYYYVSPEDMHEKSGAKEVINKSADSELPTPPKND